MIWTTAEEQGYYKMRKDMDGGFGRTALELLMEQLFHLHGGHSHKTELCIFVIIGKKKYCCSR